MHNFIIFRSYARRGLQKKSQTSGGRYERKRIWQYPKRTVLLDNIFMQSATPKVNRYLHRVIDRGPADTDRLCDRCLVELDMRNHWSSYYKWLQKGKWSWLALARQFVRLVLASIQCDVVHLVIDDTDAAGFKESTRQPDSSPAR